MGQNSAPYFFRQLFVIQNYARIIADIRSLHLSTEHRNGGGLITNFLAESDKLLTLCQRINPLSCVDVLCDFHRSDLKNATNLQRLATMFTGAAQRRWMRTDPSQDRGPREWSARTLCCGIEYAPHPDRSHRRSRLSGNWVHRTGH